MHPSLEILSRLVILRDSGDLRQLYFLRPPEGDLFTVWYMFVPSIFNLALDIRKTPRVELYNSKDEKLYKKSKLIWTQGSEFYFKYGDTLYNTSHAYDDIIWGESLKYIKLCISVKDSYKATSACSQVKASPGMVSFLMLLPNRNHSRLLEHKTFSLSQDDFIKFLIIGPFNKELKKAVS